MNKAYVRGRAAVIPAPEVDGEPFLVVEIEISCNICGEQEFMIAGHHLRPLLSLLQEFIAAEPELTAAGEVEMVDSRTYTVPYDPNGGEH